MFWGIAAGVLGRGTMPRGPSIVRLMLSPVLELMAEQRRVIFIRKVPTA